jgi:exoribonuclease II
VNISDICKRVFDLGLSSYSNWPIQILCDIHMLNDHRCITFSSIVKIHNNTETQLILLNIDSIHAKKHKIAKIDVNDEYYIPIASLYKHSTPTIFIGIDA